MTVLVLGSSSVSVAPGEEVAVEIRVFNDGEIVDEVRLTVLGETASWAALSQPALNLYPGSEGTVSVVFRPPQGIAFAGTLAFGVLAASAITGSTVVEEGEVHLAGAGGVAAEISPRTARARRRSRHRVTVHNTGNQALDASVWGRDPDDALHLEVSPDQIHLAPGEAAEVRVEARSYDRPGRREVRRLPFTVTVSHDAGTTDLDAALEQRRGGLPAIVGVAAVAAAVALVVGLVTLTGGNRGRTAATELANSRTDDPAGVTVPGEAGAGTGGEAGSTGAAGSSPSDGGGAAPGGGGSGGSGGSAPGPAGGPAPAGATTTAAAGKAASSPIRPNSPTATAAPAGPATAFAVVGQNQALVRGTAGTTAAGAGSGVVDVTFAFDVSRCAFVATLGSTVDNYIYTPGAATTALGGSSRTVRVRTVPALEGDGSAHVGRNIPFHLTVWCGGSTFAVVNPNGSLARGGGAVGATRRSDGLYEVTFNRDVSGCGFVASLGDPGGGSAPAGAAFVAGSGSRVVVAARQLGTYPPPVIGSGLHVAVACGTSLFAVVDASGSYSVPASIRRSSPGTSLESWASSGRSWYNEVLFPRAVNTCAWVGNVGSSGAVPPTEGHISVNRPDPATQVEAVHPEVKNGGGGVGGGAHLGFHLAVVC